MAAQLFALISFVALLRNKMHSAMRTFVSLPDDASMLTKLCIIEVAYYFLHVNKLQAALRQQNLNVYK